MGGLFGVGVTGHVVVVVVDVGMNLMILTTMTMMIDTDDMVGAWFDDACGPMAMGFESHS